MFALFPFNINKFVFPGEDHLLIPTVHEIVYSFLDSMIQIHGRQPLQYSSGFADIRKISFHIPQPGDIINDFHAPPSLGKSGRKNAGNLTHGSLYCGCDLKGIATDILFYAQET